VKAICIKETTSLKLFRIYEFRIMNSNISTSMDLEIIDIEPYLFPYKKMRFMMATSRFNEHFKIIEE